MQKISLKKLAVLLTIFTIAGCSSRPREVTASIPLVPYSQEKPDKKQIPTQYWSVLSDPQQTRLEHDQYYIQLSALYRSALGVTCRELTIIDNQSNQNKRTVCDIPFIDTNNQATNAWFMEKVIIESNSHVEL